MMQQPAGSTAAPEGGLAEDAARRVESQVALERLKALYDRTPQALWGGFVFGALLAWAVTPSAGAAWAWGWYAIRSAVLAWRYLDWRAFDRSTDWASRAPSLKTRYDVTVTLDGLVWGVCAVIFHSGQDSLLNGALLASLVGVASVGVFTLTSHFAIAMRFMAAVLVPPFALYVSHGGALAWLISGGLVIYYVIIWVEARSTEARTLELLRLRFENAAIAEQRQRALRLAEHSSAAKSRFLATVSHELRTPLNGILGMTQLLAMDGLPAAQASRLGVVQNSARHLLSVIADLLDVSRIEYGRIDLHPQAVCLPDLLAEVADLLRPVAQAKGLKLRLTIDAGLPRHAQCDPVRVKQVLHNLIGNAIKFTARGEVALAAARQGDQLVFTVSDTGEGIEPDQIARIFDAFEQAPAHADARRSGTGLGLTISRHLARAMGGDIGCRSVIGIGTAFEFSFGHLPAQPDTDPAGPPASTLQAPGASDRRLQILVVEDNPVNAMVATSMLERLGLGSQVASDGAQALTELARERFDLVLMDCQMPVLDGFAATRRWRAIEAAGQAPATGRLPIVALTANAVTGDDDSCRSAGMDGYLSKPFTLEALRTEIARHLSRSA
ncbi:MAG: response regulator [Vitreoscilla sp.]|nr:response regulator [Vitreoscilla sp.]